MGLIVSSTLQTEPCVSPMCNCAIRLVAQWDLTVGDLRAGSLWFRSSSRALHVSLEGPDVRSDVLNWQFVLVPSSHLLHLACPRPTNEWDRLYPGWGPASYMRVQFWGLPSSVLHRSLYSLGWSERLRWVVGDYFRRKRCARMAASSGLTGWASWPRRLTGGMLPNWRLVRKLLASWIVFFSSANSSCCRM